MDTDRPPRAARPNIVVPRDVWRSLRVIAARRDTTLRRLVAEILERAAREGAPEE